MARKKNPDNKTILLVLAVLALGGYIVYDEVKKRKKKIKELKPGEEDVIVEPEQEGFEEPMFSIGIDCMRNTIPFTQENRDIAQGVIDESIDALGGYEALPDTPEVLQQFLQAWATQIFLRTTHPNCITIDPIEGAFGPDFTDLALEMPETAMLYYRMLLFSLQFRFQDMMQEDFGDIPYGVSPAVWAAYIKGLLGSQIETAPTTEQVVLNQAP